MRTAIHPLFPRYDIYEDGTVRRREAMFRRDAGGELPGRVLESGYRQHKLVRADGKRVHIRTNRLVLEAFKGAAPTPKDHAAHLNGDRLDNALSNLAWKTPKENMADRVTHGTQLYGDRVPNCKANDELVLAFLRVLPAERRRGDVARAARSVGLPFSIAKKVVFEGARPHLRNPAALDRRPP